MASTMSVRELKEELRALNVSWAGCVEKGELVALLERARARRREQEEHDAQREGKSSVTEEDDHDDSESEADEEDGAAGEAGDASSDLDGEEGVMSLTELLLEIFPSGRTTEHNIRVVQWYYKRYPPVNDPTKLQGRLAHGREFGMHLGWEPAFIDSCCYHGVFPMAGHVLDRRVMLPKLHTVRCVLMLEDMHIRRSTKKRARKFAVTMDRAWDEVVHGINDQHGFNWLYPELAASYKHIRSHNGDGTFRATFHSIEIWMTGPGGSDVLVAGEIGFVVGSMYTSLTGFKLPGSQYDGSGTVQINTLGVILRECGLACIDFGMPMPYKLELGAKRLPREVFLSTQRACRGVSCSLRFEGKHNAADVLARRVDIASM